MAKKAKYEAPLGVACDKCELCTKAKTVKLPAMGSPAAKLMVVIGAPGREEDLAGKLLMGRYGGMFRALAKQANLSMEDMYVTAAVKCSTDKHKKSQLDACKPNLLEEVATVGPKAIVVLGAVALRQLFGEEAKLTKYRGRMKTLTVGNLVTKVFATWDPWLVVGTRQKMGDLKKGNEIVEDMDRARLYCNDELPVYSEDKMSQFNIVTIDNETDLIDALGLALEQPMIAIDTETEGLSRFKHPKFLNTLQMAISDDSAFVIPVHHPSSTMDVEVVQEALRVFFENYDGQIVAHNGKFDQKAIWSATGVIPKLSFDTMVAHNLITGDSKGNDLKSMACKYTDFGGYEGEIDPWMDAVKGCTSKIPIEPLAKYGALDTIVTYRIKKVLEQELHAADRKENVRYVARMMASLSDVLSEVEVGGVPIDWDFLDLYKKDLEREAEEYRAEIRNLAGAALHLTVTDMGLPEFNYASPRQISHLLYKRMGLKPKDVTPKGAPSVSKAALGNETHPIADWFLKLAANAQNLKLYVQNYPGYRPLGDNKIYPEYSLIHYTDEYGDTGTRSGRLSSRNPTIQNLPKEGKSKVRMLFVPDDADSLIINADYSQLEYRVAAMYAQDKGMIAFLNAGGDYHQYVASILFNVDPDQVTKDQRTLGKTLNFASLFSAGPEKIAKTAKISTDEATALLERYYSRFPAIKKWKKKAERDVAINGWIDTLFGRRRAFPDATQEEDYKAKAHAQRAAVNHQCQSAGADICYTGIVRVNEYLKKNNLKTRMLFTVHDSIAFSSPKSEVRKVIPNIIDRMENTNLSWVEKTGVFIKVDVQVGVSFGALMDYEKAYDQFGL